MPDVVIEIKRRTPPRSIAGPGNGFTAWWWYRATTPEGFKLTGWRRDGSADDLRKKLKRWVSRAIGTGKPVHFTFSHRAH